jgi:hypothetical protein
MGLLQNIGRQVYSSVLLESFYKANYQPAWITRLLRSRDAHKGGREAYSDGLTPIIIPKP